MKQLQRSWVLLAAIIVIMTSAFSFVCSPVAAEILSNEEYLQQKQTLAVFSAASLSDLKKAATLWAVQTQNPAAAGLFGSIRKAAQGGLLDSFDTKKPFGALLLYDKNGFPAFLPIAFLPTGQAEQAAQRLAASVPLSFSIPAKDSTGASLKINAACEGKVEPWNCCGLQMFRVVFDTPAGSPAIYLRSEGNWTFLSTVDAALIDLPADPAAFLDTLPKRYLLGYRVNGRLLAETLPQLKKYVKDTSLTLADQIEGGFAFDAPSGSLYSEFRVQLPEDSPLLAALRRYSCETLRYDYILQSPSTLAFCAAAGDEKSFAGFANFTKSGLNFGALFDTPELIEPIAESLYEVGAHTQGVEVSQPVVETYVLQRGRFVLTGVGVPPKENPDTLSDWTNNHLNIAAASGRGTGNQKESMLAIGQGARQTLENVIAVRYVKNSTVVSQWNRHCFYGQIRVGQNLTGYNFTRDRLAVKVGLDENALVGRFEIEKDVVGAFTAFWVSLEK